MIRKVVNVAFSLSALAIRSLPPSGKEHSSRTREAIDDPFGNAVAKAWQSEFVKQNRFNSTIRKDGARKKSVIISGTWKVGLLALLRTD
jgi:hypothetical protein